MTILNIKKLNFKALLKFFHITYIIFFFNNCNYYLYHDIRCSIFRNKDIFICKNNSYSDLIYSIKNEFYKKNIKSIKFIECNVNKFPVLMISNVSKDEKIISIFKDGNIAEYQIILNINGYVSLSKTKIIPIKLVVDSSLLNNSILKSAKYVNKDNLIKEMYFSSAQQLVDKFLLLCSKYFPL